jgi:hypothetical protein
MKNFERQRAIDEAKAKQKAVSKQLLEAKPSQEQTNTVVRLKIEICESVPSIWRVVTVGAWMNFAELHLVVQRSFNWYEQHLHSFQIGAASFGPFVEELGDAIENEMLLTIAHILAADIKEFSYEYDFGDSWLHRIDVLGTEPLSDDNSKPSCLAGERAGPLEDVGGIHGYHEILKALATPNHPDRNNVIECVAGEDFNPDYFSVDETNEKLNRYRWRTH